MLDLYGYFGKNEVFHIGEALRVFYEDRDLFASRDYDEDWQRVTDHAVEAFTCISGGPNENTISIFGKRSNSY